MGQWQGSLEGVERLMENLSFYKGRRVFVTGHTGFKGSWLCRILSLAGADVFGFALAPSEQPNLYSLLAADTNIQSVYGDIRDYSALYAAYKAADPEIVFHLAAQPLVRESYKEPVFTYDTNVMGTVHILECLRTVGNARSFVNVTTDKVYLNLDTNTAFAEDVPLCGYDPYSNSKSCSELVTYSYRNSFFANSDVAISTARAGNVIGGGDFANDRILPDCIRAAVKGLPVQVRNPFSIRPYQHVLEPLFAYLMIAQRQHEDVSLGDSYNVGPDISDCLSTGELVEVFCKSWGMEQSWENKAEADAPHEASFLKLDCEKIKNIFGWKPSWDISEAVRKTVEWTKVWLNGGDICAEMDRQIAQYQEVVRYANMAE